MRMNNKKGPFTDGPKKNTSSRVYITNENRTWIERNIEVLVIIAMFAIAAVMITSIYRDRAVKELTRVQIHLEEARSENDALQTTILYLQAEKDALKGQAALTMEAGYKTICSTGAFKSWMDYKAITSPTSTQFKLQQEATTDKNYGFRMVDGYILVAMGLQYGPVGTKYIIEFKDGKVINAMIGDIKHEGCTSSGDDSMLEFIINLEALPRSIKSSGNFSGLFAGSIKMIRLVE